MATVGSLHRRKVLEHGRASCLVGFAERAACIYLRSMVPRRTFRLCSLRMQDDYRVSRGITLLVKARVDAWIPADPDAPALCSWTRVWVLRFPLTHQRLASENFCYAEVFC